MPNYHIRVRTGPIIIVDYLISIYHSFPGCKYLTNIKIMTHTLLLKILDNNNNLIKLNIYSPINIRTEQVQDIILICPDLWIIDAQSI